MLFENEIAEVLKMVADAPPPYLQITPSSTKTDAVRNEVSAKEKMMFLLIYIYFYSSKNRHSNLNVCPVQVFPPHNGLNCPSKWIRRNSYYYVGGNNQYHWCHQCFGELNENQTIDMGDVQIRKENLVKKKNDEFHEESWVRCDKCER